MLKRTDFTFNVDYIISTLDISRMSLLVSRNRDVEKKAQTSQCTYTANSLRFEMNE